MHMFATLVLLIAALPASTVLIESVPPVSQPGLVMLGGPPPPAAEEGAFDIIVIYQNGLTFSVPNLVINSGDSVYWSWNDRVHTVTEGLGPVPTGNEAFDEPLDEANPAAIVCFDEGLMAAHPRPDNVYSYYCIPDFAFGMTGTITVRERYGAFLDGGQVQPPSGSSVLGSGTVRLNKANRKIIWDFSFDDLNGAITGVHLHGPGPLGQVGVLQQDITADFGIGSAFLSNAQVADLEAGLWYVDVHTDDFPDGEIRGQILQGNWSNLGGGTAGVNGLPELKGTGPLTGLSLVTLELIHGPPGALALVWVSLSSSPLAAFGGTLHAFPYLDQALVTTGGSGGFFGSTLLPPYIPPATDLWFQFLLEDPSVVYGLTLSNAQRATTP